MDNISRRSLISAGLGAGLVAALPGAAVATSIADDAGLRTDPFMLGIASGEPWADGFVIWTRLALDPLAEDGLGSMPSRQVPVAWEVAEDPNMRTVVARGVEHARIETAHSVHVELKGLKPGREYFYRFRSGRHVSETGRTLTAPALHETPGALAMAFASCSQYEHGYFTAYRRLAEDHPDLVLHLGDYLYEYKKGSYVIGGGNPRDHQGPETSTLQGYRQRHAQYKADADLQAAHAIAPWLVVWDDHEVDNNWADEVPENTDAGQLNDTTERFRQRRAAAFQAYYENMPLRASSVPAGFDMKIYRTIQWGQLANFHMMDTRQYRDDQLAGDGWQKNVTERLAEDRTITGAEQEKWLLDGFQNSTQRCFPQPHVVSVQRRARLTGETDAHDDEYRQRKHERKEELHGRREGEDQRGSGDADHGDRRSPPSVALLRNEDDAGRYRSEAPNQGQYEHRTLPQRDADGEGEEQPDTQGDTHDP
jgi:alkaline phosphatase D